MDNYIDKVKKVCVLMGRVGSGKTTIFSKLCSTYHNTEYASDNETKRLAMHDASFGDHPFSVIDTPGLGSKE